MLIFDEIQKIEVRVEAAVETEVCFTLCTNRSDHFSLNRKFNSLYLSRQLSLMLVYSLYYFY